MENTRLVEGAPASDLQAPASDFNSSINLLHDWLTPLPLSLRSMTPRGESGQFQF